MKFKKSLLAISTLGLGSLVLVPSIVSLTSCGEQKQYWENIEYNVKPDYAIFNGERMPPEECTFLCTVDWNINTFSIVKWTSNYGNALTVDNNIPNGPNTNNTIKIPGKIVYKNKTLTLTDFHSAFEDLSLDLSTVRNVTVIDYDPSIKEILGGFKLPFNANEYLLMIKNLIGSLCLNNFKNLKSVTFNKNATYIPTFTNCSSLTEIEIPDNVKVIKKSCFYECNTLINITLPKNLKSIESRAFAFCYSLKNITLPDNLDYIGEYAFWDCDSLETITFPDSVKTFEEGIFGTIDDIVNTTIKFHSERTMERFLETNPWLRSKCKLI